MMLPAVVKTPVQEEPTAHVPQLSAQLYWNKQQELSQCVVTKQRLGHDMSDQYTTCMHTSDGAQHAHTTSGTVLLPAWHATT